VDARQFGGRIWMAVLTGSTKALELDLGEEDAALAAAAVQNPIKGRWEAAGDDDWFAVTLQANKTYLFDLKLPAVTDPEGFLSVRSASGDEFAFEAGRNRVVFTPEADGVYYVSARSAGTAGVYSLTGKQIADDAVDNVSTDDVLNLGQRRYARWEAATDEDWFKVTLEAGKTYLFTLTPPGSNPEAFGFLSVLLGDGTVGASAFGGDRVVFTAQSSGTYYVSAQSFTAGGVYSLFGKEIVDDYVDYAATTGTLPLGGRRFAKWEAATDEDWFATDLVAGKTYLFTLTMPSGSFPGAGRISVVDGSGEQSFVGGLGDQVVFTAQTSGKYYISAQSLFATGTYSMVGKAIADDYVDYAATTGTLNLGERRYGKWEAATDEDWFKVTLEADKTYLFTLSQSNAPPFSQRDLSIMNADGEEISFDASADRLVFSPEAGGTYYVSARSVSATGQYSVVGREITDDYVDHAGTDGTLVLGARRYGRWEVAADDDWFAVQLTANKTYLFDLTLPTGAQEGSGEVSIASASGEEFGLASSGRRLHFTADATGTYYVSAKSEGASGRYSLVGREITDDRPDNPTTGEWVFA
jgi:hypothetical protein